MKIISIETSCDETAAAVIEDGRKICSSVIHTQGVGQIIGRHMAADMVDRNKRLFGGKRQSLGEIHPHQHRTDEAQLLADHAEDKVVGALRQPELLFDAVAKALIGQRREITSKRHDILS